jgi:hypothetical protein
VAAAEEEQRRHPDATVEIWAMDEHRIGLKPIVRAPVGERPIALGHHRFEWLYVTGFVEPASGRTVWNIANAICKEVFELVLADFAKSVGAGPTKRIVLQLDNAGWHGPENLAVPDVNAAPIAPLSKLSVADQIRHPAGPTDCRQLSDHLSADWNSVTDSLEPATAPIVQS